nr:platelet glycoprotein Ib alpha chain-like [Nicotiana tomentosiformis]
MWDDVEAVQYLEKLALGDAAHSWLAGILFKGKITTTVGQSDKPSVVGSKATAEPSTTPMPSTAAEPSTGTSTMPPSSYSRPSTTVPVPASSTYPLTTLRVSQTLASLNNWIQTATSKLSDISSTVVTQSSTLAEPQMLQMLTNPMVPQPGDDEIQLEETEEGDADSHPETT